MRRPFLLLLILSLQPFACTLQMGAYLSKATRNGFGLVAGILRLGPFIATETLIGREIEKYDSKYNEYGTEAFKNDQTVDLKDFKDVLLKSKDGTRIHAVIDCGNHRVHGKRPIVFVHGFPELWISWIEQLKYFLKLGHPVMAINMRGYGLSDKPKGLKSYDVFVMLEDIRAAVQYAKDDCVKGGGGELTPLLVAHDWGAAVCWEYVKQGRTTKDREIAGYASLTIAPGECFEANFNLRQIWASMYMVFFNMSWLPEKVFLAFNGWFVGRIMNGTKTSILPSWISNTYRANCLEPGAMTAQLNYYRAAIQIGSRTDPKDILGSRKKEKGDDFEVRRLDLPVLMIRGKDDDALTEVCFRGYDRYLSNAKLVAFDNCSHWITADRSSEVNQNLEKFLEEL